MQNRNYLRLFFCILVVIIFSLVSTAGTEITGKIWKPVPLRTQAQKDAGMPGGEGMQMGFSMSYAPSNPEIVYFTSNTSQVWKSTDGGYSWESKRNGFRSNGGVSLVVDPTNENVVFVSGSRHGGTNTSPVDGIYRTVDGGDSWDWVFPTAYYANKEGQHFVFDPRDCEGTRCMTVYAGTHTKGLLKSIDGGETWDPLADFQDKWIADIESHLYTPVWYDINWMYRQKITIDSAITASDLEDFPLLIKIEGPENPVFKNARPEDGWDIVFTSSDGVKLNHEIETYDNSAGSEMLEAWVKIPLLRSEAKTTIYMYYGYSAAAEQQYPKGVWDSNYVMVQHLNENNTIPDGLVDSTANVTHCTAEITGGTTDALGQIGGADELDGANDFINCGDVSALKLTGSFTVEAWFNPDRWDDDEPGNKIIANKYDYDSDGDKGWFFGRSYSSNPGLTFKLADGAGNVASISGKGDIESLLGTWIHAVAVFQAGEFMNIYINGDEKYSTITDWLSFADADGYEFQIAKRSDWDFYYDGLIDEVRVSNIARNADWIAASYINQSAPGFIQYGGEEDQITVMGSGGMILYVTTNQGLYKVIDSGDVAVSTIGDLPAYPITIALHPQNNPVNDIIYAAVGEHKAYKSMDGGQTFVSKDYGLTIDEQQYTVIDISNACIKNSENCPDGDYLYISVHVPIDDRNDVNTPFYSHDGGESWKEPEETDDGLSINPGIGTVSVTATHPDNPAIALHNFAGRSRLSETTDGGETWHYSGNGYMGGRRSRNKTSTYFGPLTGDPADREIIFFLLDFGPAVTYDNGDTWELMDIPLGNGPTTTVGAVDSNDTSDTADDIIIAAIGSWNDPYQIMRKSTDGGVSWNLIDDTWGSYQFMTFSSQYSGVVYAGTEEKSWISFDSGAIWTEIPGKRIRAVFADYGNRDIVYAFEACDNVVHDSPQTGCRPWLSMLWRAYVDSEGIVNESIEWENKPLTLNPFMDPTDVDIDPLDSSRLYVGRYIKDTDGTGMDIEGHGGFWIYDGISWQSTGESLSCTYSCVEAVNGFACDTICSETAETGGIEREYFDDIGSHTVQNVVVDPNNPDIVYAGMSASGLGQREKFIYRSIDKGMTWEEIGINLDGFGNVHGLAVDPYSSVLYMSSSHGNYALCTENDGEGGPCGEADISPDPASKDFGDVVVDSVSPTQVFTISNNGKAGLVISAVYLTWTNPLQFKITSDNCQGQTLAPSTSCTIEARYEPTKTGTMYAKIGVDSNDPDMSHLYLYLTGTGTIPDISSSPESKDFGDVVVDSVSLTQAFTISNNGTADLEISSIYLTGTNPYQFKITSDNCHDQTLAPSTSCTIEALYAPTKTGIMNAEIGINSNDPDTSILYVNLTGTGTGVEPIPDISATPASEDFGSVAVGSSVSQTFTITNIGTADLVTKAVYLTGDNPYQFSIQANCSYMTIAPSGSCTIVAAFSPTKTGALSALVGMGSNDPDTPTLYIELTGTGF